MTSAATANPSVTLQGIQIPKSQVNATVFQQLTRRQNLATKTIANFAGFGLTDNIPILQTGIVTYADVRVLGTLTVTPGSGTVASTYRWPYGIIKALRFSANGQSNLINCSGWYLKAFAYASRVPGDDRGVAQGIGGASPGTSTNQGTLALANESWGVGEGVTAIASGTYNVELTFAVPIAYDQISLMGAIFAQTTSSALQIGIDWESQANLFTLTGNAAITFSPQVIVEGTAYTIPSYNGGIVVPNLSVFHSLVENPISPSVSNGLQEVTFAGQGVGRQMMRAAFRVRNGSNAQPLAMNDTNYGNIYWRYGGNTTPETYNDGSRLAEWNERLYNTDVAQQGFGFFDFSSLWAPRDSIDEGSVTALRFGMTIQSGVSLSSAAGSYATQELVAGGQAA
jgi:hypothetical protein